MVALRSRSMGASGPARKIRLSSSVGPGCNAIASTSALVPSSAITSRFGRLSRSQQNRIRSTPPLMEEGSGLCRLAMARSKPFLWDLERQRDNSVSSLGGGVSRTPAWNHSPRSSRVEDWRPGKTSTFRGLPLTTPRMSPQLPLVISSFERSNVATFRYHFLKFRRASWPRSLPSHPLFAFSHHCSMRAKNPSTVVHSRLGSPSRHRQTNPPRVGVVGVKAVNK